MASSPLQSGSDEESDEDVYVVKRILAEGGTDEERLFLIEWEGYPIEESTWEPEANVLSKETLKAWKEEKTRQREGLSKPLDTDEFERRQENYNRRKRRQEKLGLPPQSKYHESDDNGNSSSDQAEEADVEVPDYEGMPSPKKPRQPLVKHHDRTFRDHDTVMNDASDESDVSLNERRRVPKPALAPSASEDRNRKEVRPAKTGTQTKASVHKAPIIEAPSATGYQGTAHKGGSGSSSTIAPREKPVRGRVRMVGRDSHMAKTKPKVRRTIENRILNETRPKEPKAPQLFATKSMERRFELGARALADRPSAQLPRLINPAEYSNLSRIRKRSSATASAAAGQQPVPSPTVAIAPMVSSPKELSPQQDTTTADSFMDDTGQTVDKAHKPPYTRKVSFAVEETDRDQLEQLSPKAPPSGPLLAALSHAPTAPTGSVFASPPVRKVSLANYSAKHGVTQRPVSMDNQSQGVWGETTLKSFLGDSQVQVDPIMLTFTDVDVQNMSWGAALQEVQKKDLIFSHICRSTDIDNFKLEFNPTLLARGKVTAVTGDDNKGQETISALADYLRVNICGLLGREPDYPPQDDPLDSEISKASAFSSKWVKQRVVCRRKLSTGQILVKALSSWRGRMPNVGVPIGGARNGYGILELVFAEEGVTGFNGNVEATYSLTDSQKECLAADGGMSVKNCQDRLDLMNVVGRLVRPKNENERDLDAVLQADGTSSLLVFADESVKPSDDQGLVSYFAYWSMNHLKAFRKFIAIGSKYIPKEYEEADTQAKSSSSTKSTKSPIKSRWKRDAFSSVDGANDGHDAELDDMDADDSPEESDPDVNTDPGVLQFINQTGIKRSKAAEFMERSKGNLTLALKLYEIYENAKMQAEEVAGGPRAAATPPVPPTTHAAEANVAIPSTEDATTEDIVMEDAQSAAPEVAPEAAPPTAPEATP
ncbi:hypothetical protein V491_01913, partial [Pseudogymnoascus sp. VKM F-3775]